VDQELLAHLGRVEDRHWWFVVRRGIVSDAIEAHRPDRVDAVLEVGCGAGGFLAQLSRLFPGATVRGVEPSDAARAGAVARGYDVSEGLFQDLSAADGSADVLVALDVLEHCEDDSAALAEARRVLRPGGVLVLTVPALPSMWSEHDRVNGHHRRYTRGDLAARARAAGLEVLRATCFNTVLLPPAWVARAGAEMLGLPAVSGVRVPFAPVNAALRGLFGLERPWLRGHDLPVGTSVLLVARRPRDAG
jgi:SAM-dependent methyltransferase